MNASMVEAVSAWGGILGIAICITIAYWLKLKFTGKGFFTS